MKKIITILMMVLVMAMSVAAESIGDCPSSQFWLEQGQTCERTINGFEFDVGVVDVSSNGDMCGISINGEVVWIDVGNDETLAGLSVDLNDAELLGTPDQDKDRCMIEVATEIACSTHIRIEEVEINSKTIDRWATYVISPDELDNYIPFDFFVENFGASKIAYGGLYTITITEKSTGNLIYEDGPSVLGSIDPKDTYLEGNDLDGDEIPDHENEYEVEISITDTADENECQMDDITFEFNLAVEMPECSTSGNLLEQGKPCRKTISNQEHEVEVVDVTEDEGACGVSVDGDVIWIDVGYAETINGITVHVDKAEIVEMQLQDEDTCTLDIFVNAAPEDCPSGDFWLNQDEECIFDLDGSEYPIQVVDVTDNEDECGISVDGDITWIEKGDEQVVNGVLIEIIQVEIVEGHLQDHDKCKIDLSQDKEDLECYESDNGIDYFNSGYVSINNGVKDWDECDNNYLHERYCRSDNTAGTRRHYCEEGCRNGVCLEDDEEEDEEEDDQDINIDIDNNINIDNNNNNDNNNANDGSGDEDDDNDDCVGCKTNNLCVNTGVRFIDGGQALYCDIDKLVKSQKETEESCQNNFECVSNLCVDSKCQSMQSDIASVQDEEAFKESLMGVILEFVRKVLGLA